MKMISAAAAVCALVFSAAPGFAQTTPCGFEVILSGCIRAYQAFASAAPQYGIAAAAGSPVPGVEGTRGLTLGLIPKTTAALRVSAAAVHLPDLDVPEGERSLVPISVKLGTATRLFEGLPTGMGAFDLLLEAGVLTGPGDEGRTAAAVGAGARVGLLRETFASPGVALSGMFRHTGPIRHGTICHGRPGCDAGIGEANFGVNDVSARLTAGKRLGPVGVLAGAGWDRFSTTHGTISYYGGGFEPVAATVDAEVHDSRWSAFVNLSKNLLIGSAVAEAGWMSGGEAVPGYDPASSGYDPGQGTFFGSVALRFQL